MRGRGGEKEGREGREGKRVEERGGEGEGKGRSRNFRATFLTRPAPVYMTNSAWAKVITDSIYWGVFHYVDESQ
jgi:hypothetical protein